MTKPRHGFSSFAALAYGLAFLASIPILLGAHYPDAVAWPLLVAVYGGLAIGLLGWAWLYVRDLRRSSEERSDLAYGLLAVGALFAVAFAVYGIAILLS